MSTRARYVIVLDRLDDDDMAGDGLNDETEKGGCAQVAAELQEAMDATGQPAGFFNVVAREVTHEPSWPNVSNVDPGDGLRQDTADLLTREREQR